MQSLVTFLIEKRYALAVLTLLVGAWVTFGAQHITMDATSRAILSEDDPYKAEVDQARKDFPPSTSVIFAFEAQGDEDIFSLTALTAMDEMTERYAEVKSAIGVTSLLNRRLNDAHAERYDRDYLVPAIDSVDEAMVEQIKRLALNDEDLTESILSPDGTMALARIKYKANQDDQATRLEIAESVIDLRDSLRAQYPGVDIYVLGNVLFERDGYLARTKDNQVMFPLVVGIGLALLWFCLRSFSYALGLFLVSFATIGLTLGTFGWLDIALNQISRLGPLVVLVVAIAAGIHIASVYVQGLHQGLGKMAAMRESLTINLQPVTLATITTAIGFLGLNYSSSPGIYGFGNVIAVGVIWAYVLTLALLPAILLLLPARKVAKPLGIARFIDHVRRVVVSRERGIFWGSALIIIATLFMLPLNQLDFNRYNFVDEDSDLHHVIDALANKIGNDRSLVYSIHSGEYYGITSTEFLAQVDRFSEWLDEQPDVSFVTSYTDYLRGRNKAEHDDDETYDVIPEDQLQIIDYLVGYQLIQEIEPSLEPIFNSDYSAVRMIVGTSNLSNLELVRLNDRIDGWIADNVSENFRVMHGDNSILFARLDRAITVELMQGFTLSFILITLTLIVGLKSFRYGALSIMPNLFPATIVFGFWGLFMGELSPYILMLFSISIGIVVDDSVHILSKYISARRRGEAPEPAVQYSLDRAGSAITITTLTLAIGTSILAFSSTFHFQNLAMLLTPIIVVAWLLDLYFLPPLLTRFDRWIENRRPEGVSATS